MDKEEEEKLNEKQKKQLHEKMKQDLRMEIQHHVELQSSSYPKNAFIFIYSVKRKGKHLFSSINLPVILLILSLYSLNFSSF